LSSCVSQQKYQALIQDKDRLDVSVERAHKEIKELKETKLNLEDQIKYKNVEIAKLENQVSTIKKQADAMGQKFDELEDQMKKMSADLENKKYESALLVASYERKMQIAIVRVLKPKRKLKSPKRQIRY
jgi:chromosome segregation ATPase